MEFIINFKTYKYGEDVLKLANAVEDVDKSIIVGLQISDISLVSNNTELKVYSQHVDPVVPGRETGFITPESVKASGAIGTFLNHSEHPLDFEVIEKTVKRCKEIGLKTAVFASSIEDSKKIEKLNPDYLIYEPPELVGGDVSVSSSKPEMIEKMNEEVGMDFLVGAGIKTKEDVETAIKLGSKGIAISSAITKAENPKEEIRKLIVE